MEGFLPSAAWLGGAGCYWMETYSKARSYIRPRGNRVPIRIHSSNASPISQEGRVRVIQMFQICATLRQVACENKWLTIGRAKRGRLIGRTGDDDHGHGRQQKLAAVTLAIGRVASPPAVDPCHGPQSVASLQAGTVTEESAAKIPDKSGSSSNFKGANVSFYISTFITTQCLRQCPTSANISMWPPGQGSTKPLEVQVVPGPHPNEPNNELSSVEVQLA
ncbi:hypothetical protein B0H19DRAFT_1312380 [Mycena capillaripes]|nr:hypothetical protein B0H19DRAFT_1312380 [Mycena capillaripes]